MFRHDNTTFLTGNLHDITSCEKVILLMSATNLITLHIIMDHSKTSQSNHVHVNGRLGLRAN
jgi:cell division protein FtsL